MDLPDTDKSNKETEKTIACICKMIQNEKKLAPKKFFFSIISTHYSTKYTKNKEKLMNRFFTKSKKPYFWAFLGPNWPKKIFFRKFFFHNQDPLILRLCTKNQEKLMNRFFIKSKKPYFWAFLGPNWPKKFFFENRAPSHFGHYHFAPFCQKS